MAKDLWELRQKKKMTVKQLASRSGVKAGNIYAYESGDPVRMADLEKLAKVLYVNSNEIKIQSDPIPKKKKKKPAAAAPPAAKSTPAQPSTPSAEKQASPKKQAPPKKQARQAAAARQGQIDHLLVLAQKVGHSEADVSERVGKPLAEMSVKEAKAWLKTYTEECKTLRPDDTRTKRAYLPEAVDTFELNYLTQQQEAETMMTFRLLDKTEFSGVIIGFTPYAITIRQADGRELTLQKLALAYFMTEEATA